ncbi:MAG: ECF transporter S component [Alistipes sp.]|nr:ECF transporter S component [Alistipes sp.]
MENTAKLHSLSLAHGRAWLMAAIFVAGNIVLPQLCHLLPKGGLILLPIYFFTLVASYKYGLWVGLATALLSPVANHLLFAMPAAGALAPILVKSVALAFAASYAAKWAGKVSLLAIVSAVLAYQIVGTGAEWAMEGTLSTAIGDFRLGVPGLLMQVFGGWLVLRALQKV